jgi:hypothetical protein
MEASRMLGLVCLSVLSMHSCLTSLIVDATITFNDGLVILWGGQADWRDEDGPC